MSGEQIPDMVIIKPVQILINQKIEVYGFKTFTTVYGLHYLICYNKLPQVRKAILQTI